jgi:hypothetical protein
VAPSASSALEVQVDRPRADGAAAGQRHPRLAAAGHQRAQHPHQVVVGDRAGDGRRVQLEAVRLAVRPADGHPQGLEQASHRRDVGEVGHVGEAQRLVGQQARRRRAAFLAPPITIWPQSGLPPRTRILSIPAPAPGSCPHVRSWRSLNPAGRRCRSSSRILVALASRARCRSLRFLRLARISRARRSARATRPAAVSAVVRGCLGGFGLDMETRWSLAKGLRSPPPLWHEAPSGQAAVAQG